MSGDDDANPEPSVETSPKLDGLRRSRRNQRSELYAEVLDLRTTGMSPRQIAPRTGMSVRTVERWLAAGGEPEHRRRPHARFSWIPSMSISKDAGRKADAAALQTAGRPSTGGPPPASSAHRPLRQMRDGGHHRAETVHGC
ncbi:helix-turn-helix domain-containing protein [Mesorhizobium sp. M1348]|uniref:helix-turn-helix domain-containing protein n=1 Tax=Mesorhizobium sp. M1348 TaxID=2957089 RepID=UPI00333DC4FF